MTDEERVTYHNPNMSPEDYRAQLEEEIKSPNSVVAKSAQTRLDNLMSRKDYPMKYETNSDINYAVGPQDVRVSIPSRIPRDQWDSYAREKIEEQAAMQRSRGIIK